MKHLRLKSKLMRTGLIALGIIILSIIALLDLRAVSSTIGSISNSHTLDIPSLTDFTIAPIINN